MTLIKKEYFVHFFLLSSLVSSTAFAKTSYKSEMLKASNVKASGTYAQEKFVSLMGKTFDDTPQKKVLVIGDSHAQDFINMAYESGQFKQYQVKTRHIPTGCQLILSNNNEKYIAEKLKELCRKSDSLKKALEQIKQADILILSANWKKWSAKTLPETIKNLSLSSTQKLYVIGRKSFGKVNIRKLLKKPKTVLVKLENNVDSAQEEINTIMKNSLDDDIYIDFQNTICKQKNKCKIFTDDAKLITFDGGHLTKAGAGYLGKQLFEKSILNQLK